jgi:hypothetical protein
MNNLIEEKQCALTILIKGTNLNIFLHIISVGKVELNWLSFC